MRYVDPTGHYFDPYDGRDDSKNEPLPEDDDGSWEHIEYKRVRHGDKIIIEAHRTRSGHNLTEIWIHGVIDASRGGGDDDSPELTGPPVDSDLNEKTWITPNHQMIISDYFNYISKIALYGGSDINEYFAYSRKVYGPIYGNLEYRENYTEDNDYIHRWICVGNLVHFNRNLKASLYIEDGNQNYPDSMYVLLGLSYLTPEGDIINTMSIESYRRSDRDPYIYTSIDVGDIIAKKNKLLSAIAVYNVVAWHSVNLTWSGKIPVCWIENWPLEKSISSR